MMDQASRTPLYEELVRRFASALRGAQLYADSHPLVGRSMAGLLETLGQLHATHPSLAIGIVDRQLVVADTPLPKASAALGELIQRLHEHGIERIAIERGVTVGELLQFVQAVARLSGRGGGGAEPHWSFPHIRVGRIVSEEHAADGIGGDMAAIRRLYADAVAMAETVWETALSEGAPDLARAQQVIDALADAITRNRTALIALTAMKSYDNYTFTHMVNVSILAMGQARALGVEGRLLREFGLSALMHDIGKVRTPLEILNKPAKLTGEEFTVMKRHTVDGAEILRRTPEMPLLAPVVAFEHHLRMDGTGYPDGARRASLNLGTMLCSIADVYDAMRSQRGYQEAHPTDRILAVLQRNDGTQFDQHLVRRFVQLLGIYPPGNLVRLTTGEVAVVLQVHAPDPYRPRVRIVLGPAGEHLTAPLDRNLWQTREDEETVSVVAPLDPAEFGIDPLTYL